MQRLIFFLILIVTFRGFAFEGYEKPAGVSIELWEGLEPCFFPFEDPLRPALTEIFSHERVIFDYDTFLAAGFEPMAVPGRHVMTGKHPLLPGLVVKVIADVENPEAMLKGGDWENWIRRLEGEFVIRYAISKYGFENFFKVPRQWIFPLPEIELPYEGDGIVRRHFILIAEDAYIVSEEENHRCYHDCMMKTQLTAIWKLANNYGLADSCNHDNLPFCHDGKLAFVDTETFYTWPIEADLILKHLNHRNRNYWLEITKKK